MITLTVIGSNSKGNCYALSSDKETIVLECGCSFKQLVRETADDLSPIKAAIVSHSHGDHCKYAKDFISAGAILFSTKEVTEKYKSGVAMKEGKTYRIGEFSVAPFEVYHDVPCFAFIIRHPDCGSIFFATDTYALPYEFKNVDHWLIEANYSDDIIINELQNGHLSNSQYNRILTSHMSLKNAISNMATGQAYKSKTATLLHLSSRHSDKHQFKAAIEQEFGIPCYIASKGLKVYLS